jgi:hypothetical protein
MRKTPALLATAVAAAAVAVPATAQDTPPETTFSYKGKVTPKKAGTKRNPRGVRLNGTLTFRTITQGVEPPIVTGADILLPKTGVWNGGKYAKCGLRALKRKGPKGCPKKSIVGKASGVAWADNVNAKPTVTFVNGGATRLYAYTVLYNPALVKEPVVLKIKKLRGSKWGYRTSFRVPQSLQIVAGVPITLASLKFQVGGTKGAPKLIATTGCKGGKHKFQATAFYDYDSIGQTGKRTINSSVRCTR